MKAKQRASAKTASGRSRGPSAGSLASAHWTPPDFDGHTTVRIGASVVDQFVRGHNAADVLRELVQNEFDGGGDRLAVHFGTDALEVIGNGSGIRPDGWKRLSVIVGTGRVVGDTAVERVEAKTNGIGSKNFGLRSLFLFGDRIFVRSGGHVCSLDLRTLATGKLADPGADGSRGVRLSVPFRTETFEILEPFTAEREGKAFDTMASGMLATLVKLALPGSRPGLREVELSSARHARRLVWKQTVERERSPLKGVTAVRRNGKLVDESATGRTRSDYGEIEFSRDVLLPGNFRDTPFAAYFKAGERTVRIGVSLPIRRGTVDRSRPGHFYYPLQAPDARTGCLTNVSAPFELDNDRSNLIESDWNDWLMDAAAALTVDLIKGDWFGRFGASAYLAMVSVTPDTTSRYLTEVHRILKTDVCWPTRDPNERLVAASKIVVPAEPALDGILGPAHHLHHAIANNPEVCALAMQCDATSFTLTSLVRLRCAGDDAKHLKTQPKAGEANYRFSDHVTVLSDVDRQVTMAVALTALRRRLSNANREDLRTTASTLAADGTLRAAKDLVRVAADIWNLCPEPLANRLHPRLRDLSGIAGFCQDYDETAWITQAAERAIAGTIDADERAALNARLLEPDLVLGRTNLALVRRAPVFRNQRGAWVAPDDMVALTGRTAKLLGPALSLPGRELAARPALLSRLRIRTEVDADGLVAFADHLSAEPAKAESFEKLLAGMLQKLAPAVVRRLADIPFLKSRTGALVAPASLYIDSPANRLVITDLAKLVAGSHDQLYRRLKISEFPDVDALVSIIEEAREQNIAPPRPDILYPALAVAMGREGRSKDEFDDEEILWIGKAYHRPGDVLVGQFIPKVFDQVLPVHRRSDDLSRAFLQLGAVTQARDQHWAAFFRNICGTWDHEEVPRPTRRLLADAYFQRGSHGAPAGAVPGFEWILADNHLLYSLDEVAAGLLVENDFPALAEALVAESSKIGAVLLSDRNRPFFDALRIRPLSSLTDKGTAVVGAIASRPRWWKPGHETVLIATIHRPAFASAIHALALRQRLLFPSLRIPARDEITARLRRIDRVTFHEQISKGYAVASVKAQVPVETAVGTDFIGLVAPKTKLDFQQLVAEALAEVAGATNVAQTRALASVFFPLVLSRSIEDLKVYLQRSGVSDTAIEDDDEADETDLFDDDTLAEDILSQVMSGLDTSGDQEDPAPAPPQIPPPAPPSPPTPPTPPTPLPPLADVVMNVASPAGQIIEPRPSGAGSSAWGSSWVERSGAQVERDRAVGRRGEELVYRMELERVRAQGHANPEQLVIWTSQSDPAADHDIRSIDPKGYPRWIEVKSTTGSDGRFEWSRKEFERAMRERGRYEIWRVYRADSARPVAKCFPDPAKLLGASKLQLELGMMRAVVESLGTA